MCTDSMEVETKDAWGSVTDGSLLRLQSIHSDKAPTVAMGPAEADECCSRAGKVYELDVERVYRVGLGSWLQMRKFSRAGRRQTGR